MNKIIAIIFLLFFCVQDIRGQASWQAQANAPYSWRFDDIHFLTPQKGWATNPYYSYLTPRQYGRIFTTNDGGRTWIKLIDSSLTFFRAIGFADSLHGWVGNIGLYTPDTNFMYQTADGGRSWQPVSNVTGPKPQGICGISVVNDSVIYAYGRYSGPPVIMKTTNRGLSWTSHDMSGLAKGLVDGHFFNADTGFITGAYDTAGKALILSTFDGGQSWQVRHQSARPHEIVWKVTFPSRMTGYASIESGIGIAFPARPDTTHFLKTTDGGLTWQERPFLTNGYYEEQGIGFINDSVGWIGGDPNISRNYKTTNGGLTWLADPSFGILTPPYTLSGSSLNRFRKFGDTLMYASGNTIYRFGTPSTSVITVPHSLATIKVYPNPFSDYLEVHLAAHGNAGHALLSVYNILGQVVLKDRAVQEGINRYTLPSLVKGQYIFNIRNEHQELASGLLIAR